MSYRPRQRISRRAQTELSIQFPAPDVLKHEDEIAHVNARRALDQPPQPLTPVNFSANAGEGSERLDRMPTIGYSSFTAVSASSEGAPNQESIEPVHIELPLPADHEQNPSQATAGPSVSGSQPQEPALQHPQWFTDITQWSESAEGYFAIPGPALPSDPPDTVYDLCGGYADPGAEPLSDSEEFEEEVAGFLDHFSLDEHRAGSQPPSPSPPPDMSNFESQSGPTIGAPSSPRMPNFGSITESEDWWPFANKQEALLSIMTAFPRAVFSGKELDVVRWFAEKCYIAGMPNPSALQSRFEYILKLLGLESRLVQSKLGNYFALNSLKSIIANEMSNPLVRSKLVFYPQDDGKSLKQAANGRRWMQEVDASLAAPMVRKYLSNGHHDYFVNEPFLASIATDPDSAPVPQAFIAVRFFQRESSLYAQAHRLLPQDEGYLVDGSRHVDVALESFLLPLPEFRSKHKDYGLPSPDAICGIQYDPSSNEIQPWNQPVENPWRQKSNGKLVRSLPIWLYCDDTSGNISKKWNKHNSFLFTLAGLPRTQSQLPYNIQFLSTSNIASPLEMLDEVANELRDALSNGIVAYDCEIGEDVIVIPWVYAAQGDNPMQSEMCSHIGMTGKFFCRICHVRGKDKDRVGDQNSEVERIQEFMQIHRPRHVEETIANLQAQESIALRGTFSVVDTESRKSGVKDKYLSAFLAILKDRHEAYLARSSKQSGLEFLQKLRQHLPEKLYNPALFIPELDINQDTPVEVLHVVLLGVVKYFWRDAVSRQTHPQKEVLKARIDSLDVSGLGISPLRGATLVQYAKSLTGRDFRAVVQIGPLVLFDLIPPEAYNAWIALSHVAPLVFQPEIENMDVYLPHLTHCIDALLQATVLWSPRWFNKPKFHILLHLPEHIRRFGPAVLFATETFESYNFIIRLRSVHSNRHAPSHDIGRAFCRLYAIRFLVSGGWVTRSFDPSSKQIVPATPRQAGSEILKLLEDQVFVDLMEMSHFSLRSRQGEQSSETIAIQAYMTSLGVLGNFTLSYPLSESLWTNTRASRCIGVPELGTATVKACKTVILHNNDIARLNGFVLLRRNGSPIPAKIIEILATGQPSYMLGITAQIASILPDADIYHMPQLYLDNSDASFVFVQVEAILCVVSTFHNCAKWKCPISRSKVVLQERQETNLRAQVIQHHGEASEIVLNVASLRSAAILQQLRTPPTLHGQIADVARTAVTNWQAEEERAQQEKERKENGQSKKKAEKRSQKKRKREEPGEEPELGE